MPLIETGKLSPNHALPASINHQTYCGLDSCLPQEIRPILQEMMTPETEIIYRFERALQGPYLEIMLHGFAVDEIARREAATELHSRLDTVRATLDRLAFSVWNSGLNPRSPDQLKALFYETMHLPQVWLSQKGERKLSTNREALEKLNEYLYARPFVSCILAARDLAKQLEVFETEIDSDGRYRTSYNIAGTNAGRPSSSENAFGTGGNAQNIPPSLRYVFCADPGYKLGQVDFEQVEARDLGFFCGCLFSDWSFLDACESGDLHTNTAKEIWPEMAWTGDPRQDRIIADRIFYREYSRRDMAKRGAHLSDYMGTAYTASRALKVPQPMMEEFQARYCRGRLADPKRGITAIEPIYPCIPRFWQWCAEELQTNHLLTTPFGRRRHFFGRPGDDATLRKGIAYMPQSTTADRTNLGLLRVWRKMPEVELLGQGYDSIVFQFRDRGTQYEREIISRVQELIRVEMTAPNGRKYIVPSEAKTGWNWGNEVTKAHQDRARRAGTRVPRLNLDGLSKWSEAYPDLRSRTKPLQRRMAA